MQVALSQDQISAWEEFQRTLDLTPEAMESLAGVAPSQVKALEIERLKQFARDTAHVNPNLLHDIEQGWVHPCRALTEHMDAYYAARALANRKAA